MNFMMIEILGQATSTHFTSEQVGFVIGAILTALAGGGFIGKKVQESKEVKITPNPLPVSLVNKLATKEEVEEVEQRLGSHIDEIKVAMSEERSIARTAQGKTHARIDKVAENLAEMRGELRQINSNLERLLNR